MQKEAKNKELIKTAEYDKFVEWSALPSDIRQPTTQRDLAVKLDVNEATLSQWKDREDFDKRKNELTVKWIRSGTPDVMKALSLKAKRGDVRAIELYLKFVENWAETHKVEQPNVVQAVLQKFEVIEDDKPRQIKESKGQPPKDIP